MRVGQRLFLAVIPAVLGVLAMAGLAYWGQRGRQIPEWLLIAGLLTAVASLAMAWRSTRYVARRIESLSRRRADASSASRADELDFIEARIAQAERRGETREQAARALVREYAALLADASATVGRRLDEVRLPLHILLSSPFGALNENQEEMIGAARDAAESAGEALRVMGRVVELDAGRVESQPEPIHPRDLLAPVLAAVEPRLRDAGAMADADLPLTLPRVHVDPRLAREALSMILDRVAARAAPGAVLRLTADAADGIVRLRLHGAAPGADEDHPLARRLLRAQGGSVAARADCIEIVLPAAPAPSAASLS